MSARVEAMLEPGGKPLSGAVDLTPGGVDNWGETAPILSLRPDATLHQKVALAWSMSSELETIAEAAMAARNDSHLMSALSGIVWERVSLLTRVLDAIGDQTAGLALNDGGQA